MAKETLLARRVSAGPTCFPDFFQKTHGVRIMKVIYTAVLIIAFGLAIHVASGASSPDRPAGVAERDWIPVSDKMGFVVTTPHYYPGLGGGDQPLLLTPPAEGFFMVRTRNGWQRIIIQDPLKGPASSG
jgi:hypothetical protein